jgi:protein ImuB
VWLRRLATDRLTRSRSSAGVDGAPLVIAAELKSAQRLTAVNDAAARLGLKPGLALADARAMYPRIEVADADPAADRRTLEAIADWCDRYTPLVGLDPPDGLLLDITGCAHLFGGEEALRRDIVARLARQGFHARAAVADTVGCAWAVARYRDDEIVRGRASSVPSPACGGGTGRGHPTASAEDSCPLPTPLPQAGEGARRVRGAVVPSHQTHDVLLPLPLAALRIAPETVAALAQVGLKRIADVIERPRAPIAARFGEDFVRRLDQAVGREDESIVPRLPVPPYVVERRFAEPIAREEDVLGTIEQLAQELAHLLERRGEGARIVEAALFRTDGKVHRIKAGAASPLRDAARMRSLFVERLAAIGDECDPGFGYDVIRLGALASDRSDPVQTGLAAPDHAAELAHLVDRLGARFGLRRVTRLVPQDTHIPEFAVTAVAAATTPGKLHANSSLELRRAAPQRPLSRLRERDRERAYTTGSASSPSPHPSPACGGGSRPHSPQRQCPSSSAQQESLASIRPIRLFERPELIKATAEVPDGPPKHFTWRHVRYVVAHAEGPERIAMEWWRDEQGQKLTRDYFRVESLDGLRVWLYREGFFNDRAAPNWFLHGVFA